LTLSIQDRIFNAQKKLLEQFSAFVLFFLLITFVARINACRSIFKKKILPLGGYGRYGSSYHPFSIASLKWDDYLENQFLPFVVLFFG